MTHWIMLRTTNFFEKYPRTRMVKFLSKKIKHLTRRKI
jgi:hypothetical protein